MQAYDRDGSGYIDAKELIPSLRDLGLNVDGEGAEVHAILRRYDADGDKQLDFIEFSQMLYDLRQFQLASQQQASRSRPHPSPRPKMRNRRPRRA